MRIPVQRDITVTATRIKSVNTHTSGPVKTHEFWVSGGMLWQRHPDGSTTRHRVMGPLLRTLLNENNI